MNDSNAAISGCKGPIKTRHASNGIFTKLLVINHPIPCVNNWLFSVRLRGSPPNLFIYGSTDSEVSSSRIIKLTPSGFLVESNQVIFWRFKISTQYLCSSIWHNNFFDYLWSIRLVSQTPNRNTKYQWRIHWMVEILKN